MQNTNGIHTVIDLYTVKVSNDEKAKLLEKTKWINEFSREQITLLASYMSFVKFPTGTMIFREGAVDNSMAIILSGRINIVKEAPEHHSTNILASINAGMAFGEMSLVDGEPRSAGAMSAEETTMLIITKQDFMRLSEKLPGLGLKFLWKIARMISQRLRKTSGQLVEHLNPR